MHSVLGLEVHEFDRARQGQGTIPVYDEIEFPASGLGEEDVSFGTFEPALRSKILYSGFHGDKVWERKVTPNLVLARADLSGSSLAKFRLRTGFTHVPVPFIDALRHDEIHRIALSREMAPWRLGTDYDRPVPRRIAEEAGLSRDLFGHKKKRPAC